MLNSEIGKSKHKPFKYRIEELYFLINVWSVFLPLFMIVPSTDYLFAYLFVTFLLVIVFIIFNNLFHHYYRLIKRTELKGTEEKTYYLIQTYVSNSRIEKLLNNKKINWKDFERFNKIEDAKQSFKGKTITKNHNNKEADKKTNETLLAPIKKTLHKPKLEEKLYKLIRIVKATYIGLSIGGFYFFLLKIGSNSNYTSQTWFIIGIFPITIMLLYKILSFIYSRFFSVFHRIVEVKTEQRQTEITTLRLQSCISYKNVESLANDNNINWKNVRKFSSKKQALVFFNKETSKNKVIDEVINSI